MVCGFTRCSVSRLVHDLPLQLPRSRRGDESVLSEDSRGELRCLGPACDIITWLHINSLESTHSPLRLDVFIHKHAELGSVSA